MTVSLFFQMLINGLAMGMLYILVVLGFDLILRVTNIFNFAHGEFYMLGAYALYFTCVVLQLPFVIALILSVVALALLGGICYIGVFQWVQRRFKPGMPFTYLLLTSAMASIGLRMIFSQGALVSFGTTARAVPSVFPQMISIGDVSIPAERLATIVIGLLVLAGLYFLMFKTKLGKAMRAVSLDAVASSLQGINPSRTYLMGFAVGCGLCGIAGGIIAPIFAVTTDMAGHMLFLALLVMLLGGIGSYKGAILGSIIVGLLLSFGYHFIGGLSELFLFISAIILLIFKPGGILGEVRD
jgi:branched-chain amino acid transport system permease protein